MTIVKDSLYTVVEIEAQTQQGALDELAKHFRTHPDRVLVSLHYETDQDEHGETVEYYIGATIGYRSIDTPNTEEFDVNPNSWSKKR